MTNGIQKELENLGKYGCGFLCLCHIMGVPDSELFFYYHKCIEEGLIDEECYVKDWGRLATYLCPTWHSFTCKKSNTKDPKAVFCIEYWYNARTKLHHFKLEDWDPLGQSVTVKEGTIESYRNFYC